MAVLLETTLGDLVIDLYTDRCPIASKNFLKLCKMKKYNNSLFYTVQKDYLTEIKAPENKSLNEYLEGEENKYFEDEIHKDIKYNKYGLVGTSNVGPNRNQANFFIILTDRPLQHMDGKHTIFGYIPPEEGKEVLEKINDLHVDSEENRPYYNIRIKHTIVVEDPFDDPEGLIEPEESPEQIKQDDNGRLEYHERLDLIDDEGRTEEEIVKETKKFKAKTNAVVLEMIGDIADADQAPPENILFVCKLNQATQESDLEMIFSRFGPIKKCEVVRDWKTGQSLQYAFIEFEAEAACKEAYFKMENVLIDERRIHVDFCQSVEKLWFKHKQKKSQQQQKQIYGQKINQDNEEKIVLKSQFDRSNRGKNYVFENDQRSYRENRKGEEEKYQDRGNRDRKRDRSRSREQKKKSSKHSRRSYSREKEQKQRKSSSRERKNDKKNRSRSRERSKKYKK